MKRILSTFGLVVLMSMTSLTANAHDIAVTSNGVTFYYNFANNGKELSVTFQGDSFKAYNEYSGSIVIPSTVTYNGTTYQVTSIGEEAFRQCDGLTSVTIPNSVMNIGGYAFDNCYVLTNVTIPNSVTTIGENAFSGCFALANITIPNSVTTIGDFAFEYCQALTSITIPSSVTTIGNGLFALCDALTSISVSSGNTVFDSRDNCNAIIEKATNTLVCGCDKTVIPNTVTAIGNYAFHYCNRLTSMNIPNSVTAIGNHAFDNCGSLTSVTIPNSVTTIGNYAFSYCSSLTSVTIPNSLSFISESSFKLCRALKTLIIPKSVEGVGIYSFDYCNALTSVTVYNETPPTLSFTAFSNFDATLYVPYGSKAAYEGANYWKDFASIVEMNPAQAITFADANVKALCVDNWDLDDDGELSTSEAAVVTDLGQVFKNSSQITTFQELQYFTGLTAIGNLAFYQCTSLTSVTIPSSVKDIGKQAFNNCDALTSINIPSSVTSIGQNAFSGCHGLTSITIPSPVTFIDQNTFANCINLTSVTFPNTLKRIGTGAFSNCKKLTGITFPNSLTRIDGSAFLNCSALTSITIPSSVTTIGTGVFIGCSSLTSISVNTENSVYDSRNDCNAIIETATNKLLLGCMNTVIPNTVTSIETSAFNKCSGLTSITIPIPVTTIGLYAFANCSALTSVTIQNSVTTIGDNAFQNCTTLTKVTVLAETPPTIYSQTFTNRAHATLYVPHGSKATYEGANYWKDFALIVEIDSSTPITFADAKVKALCVANWDTDGNGELSMAEAAAVTSLDRVFEDNDDITSFDELQYFTGLTAIGANAFFYCSSLTSIILPNTVTSIGKMAFCYCYKLTSVTVPSSVTSIGLYAFDSEGIKSIVVEEGNTVYDSRDNCNAIIETATNTLIFGCENTVIPSTVTTIGKGAFEECLGLTTIIIPASVTTIGQTAFQYCENLTNVTIPASVTTIDSQAFDVCTALTSVTVYIAAPLTIDKYTFSNRENATLYVPAGSIATYGTANYWKEFKEIKEIDDVNGDLNIDMADVEMISDHILGKSPTGFNANMADINCDGRISISDVTKLINVMIINAAKSRLQSKLTVSSRRLEICELLLDSNGIERPDEPWDLVDEVQSLIDEAQPLINAATTQQDISYCQGKIDLIDTIISELELIIHKLQYQQEG